MRNQPICGDMTKFIENLEGPIFTCYFASIKDFIHKIVTKTEILAMDFLNNVQKNCGFGKGGHPLIAIIFAGRVITINREYD